MPGCIHEYIPQICFPANEQARKLCTGTPLEETLGQRIESSAMTEQGDQVMIEYSISRIDIDGADEFTAIINDISERKIAEADLIEARYLAEEASQAKSEFLSNMSHELRTPLNAVLGFAQLLKMKDLGEDNNTNIDHILDAGRHLLGLIGEVLDLAKIESGSLDFHPRDIDLILAIKETLSLVKNIADEKQIEMTFDHKGFDRIIISTDPMRFKQVILNLLSNAVKYNKKQGMVSVKIDMPDESHVCIYVEDTGRGIASQHLERIFKPFDRLGSQSYVDDGTGIGLSICQHLVELMSGTISVESEPGRGSCFKVCLAC